MKKYEQAFKIMPTNNKFHSVKIEYPNGVSTIIVSAPLEHDEMSEFIRRRKLGDRVKYSLQSSITADTYAMVHTKEVTEEIYGLSNFEKIIRFYNELYRVKYAITLTRDDTGEIFETDLAFKTVSDAIKAQNAMIDALKGTKVIVGIRYK